MPLLSVIVPTYNSRTLEACLTRIRGSALRDYELIVVDDASSDGSADVARRFADDVVVHAKNQGTGPARNSGAARAAGSILVYIDSDCLVAPGTLGQVADYFERHPEVDALSGKLSKEHPYPEFFSQYKNLYMHFIFDQLPDRVHFIYGSIHAVRRRAAIPYTAMSKTEDTATGASLSERGAHVAFVRTLEVVHLKRYDFVSWVSNDFKVPFDWAEIFWKRRGWKFLGKDSGGYFHSPRWQLASVALAPLIVFAAALTLAGIDGRFAAALGAVWFLLNARFLAFMAAERGFLFAAASLPVTFFDHLVMGAGIAAGSIHVLFSGRRRHAA